MHHVPTRKIFLPLVALLLTLSLSRGLAEIALRLLISSQTWLQKKVRNSKLFAEWYSSDDFCELYYQ